MMTPQEIDLIKHLFNNSTGLRVLRFLLQEIPQWHTIKNVQEMLLNSLDDIFIRAAEEPDPISISNLQFIIGTIGIHISLEEMLDAVDLEDIISCLSRFACYTAPNFDDGILLDHSQNEKAVQIMNIFFETFYDVGTKDQRQKFQTALLVGMKDAAIFGNWPIFRVIYSFSSPIYEADNCLTNCSVLGRSLERSRWIDANWPK